MNAPVLLQPARLVIGMYATSARILPTGSVPFVESKNVYLSVRLMVGCITLSVAIVEIFL